MQRNRLQRIFRVSWPRLVAIGLLVGIWQLLVVVGVKSGGAAGAGEPLPGPGDAIAEIGYLVHIGVLVPALLQTLERAAIGYALALVMGTVIGLGPYAFQSCARASDPCLPGSRASPRWSGFPSRFSSSETSPCSSW
jgi:NitT/TauT family transport system permease protein